eukprot:4505557-Amphidinium_carterae.1
MLAKLRARSAPSRLPEDAVGLPPGLANPSGWEIRDDLIVKLFLALDVNCDNCLDKSELHVFAQQMGFDGGNLSNPLPPRHFGCRMGQQCVSESR